MFRTLSGAVSQAFDRIDTMEQFERVMTTMTGSSEKAEETLAKVNETVKGTAFGLDTAASAVQNFVTSGIEVDDATRYFESWGDAVAFYTKGTSQDLESVTDALSKMATRGKVDMEQLGRIMEAGIPAMDIYAEAMGISTEEVADQMRKGKLEAGQFMEVMDEALANGTIKFPALAGAAKEAGASWQGSFDNMKAAVARGVTNIIENIDKMLEDNGLPNMREMVSEFGKTFENVLTFIGESIPTVVEFLKGFAQTNEEVFGGVRDTIFEVFSTVWGYIQEVWQFIMELWNEYGPQLTELSETYFGIIKENVQFAFETIWSIIQTIMDLVVPYIKDVLERITKFWDENGETIMQAVDNAFTFIKGVIDFIMPIVVGIIEGAWDIITAVFDTAIGIVMGLVEFFSKLLVGDFEGASEASQKVFDTMWEGIKGIVEGAWNLLKGAFAGLWESISDWFVDLKDDAIEWGEDLIKGFWEGIKGMGSWLVRKIGGFVKDKIPEPVKKALGIHSPSRLFMGFGEDTAKGFIIGIESMSSKLQRASENMASLIQPPVLDISGQVASINRQASRQLNHTLTNELTVESKQPAYISIRLGKNEFTRFVEDITDEQNFSRTVLDEFRSAY